MAGSYRHVYHNGEYRGVHLLDHLGDAVEAIDQMFFIIQALSGGDDSKIESIVEQFYRCMRSEEPWPDFVASKRGWPDGIEYGDD